MEKIHIIGVGEDGVAGLTGKANEYIASADLVLGDAKAIAAVGPPNADTIEIGSDLSGVCDRLQNAGDCRAVILATGDPLFYGMARYLCDRLGKERFEILPHVSAMQLAFARVKESWDEAYLADLASHPLSRVVERVRSCEKAGLFTSSGVPPSSVASALLEQKIDYFSAYVCENLGTPRETVFAGELRDLADLEFGPLNVLVLVRKPGRPDAAVVEAHQPMFGRPDEAFLQSRPKRGLLTPVEIRAIALADMQLKKSSIVWDVGAGSGSVAVEAAQVAAEGRVFAIERDMDDIGLIQQNALQVGAKNLTAVHGEAPDAWADLPDPHAVFVGATGLEMVRIIEPAFARLAAGGRLVANVGSIENIAAVHQSLHRLAGDAQVKMINIALGNYQLERVRFEAMNPTFLVSATKST